MRGNTTMTKKDRELIARIAKRLIRLTQLDAPLSVIQNEIALLANIVEPKKRKHP